jgi:alpha-1,6-mannosyltransferase
VGAREFDYFLKQWSNPLLGQLIHFSSFLALGELYRRFLFRKCVFPNWLVLSAVGIWLLSVPWISPDVFFYLSKGWMEVQYGLNPYTTPLSSLRSYRSDPMFVGVVPSLGKVLGNYGPAFQLLSSVLARISGGNPKLALLLFKLVGLGALVGIVVQARAIHSRLHGQTDAELAPAEFLLNPLVLACVVGAAHNDVLLVLLMLISARAVIGGRAILGGVSIGLAVSVKISAIFIVPALVLAPLTGPLNRAYFRMSLSTAMGFVAGCALGLGMRPESFGYFAGWVGNDSAYFRSTIYILLWPLLNSFIEIGPNSLLRIGQLGFIVVGAVRLLTLLRNSHGDRALFVVRASLELLLLGQLLAMQMMNEWYLLAPVAFALILHGHAEIKWVSRMSVLYMPIVIWAIVGNGLVVFIAQSAIVIVFAFTSLDYLVQARTSRIGLTGSARMHVGR